jgi:hypothetical protein
MRPLAHVRISTSTSCLGQLPPDADLDLTATASRTMPGQLSVGFGSFALHLDRAPCALGEQHCAFGNLTVDLWGGLHQPVSTNRMGAAELLPRRRTVFHALRVHPTRCSATASGRRSGDAGVDHGREIDQDTDLMGLAVAGRRIPAELIRHAVNIAQPHGAGDRYPRDVALSPELLTDNLNPLNRSGNRGQALWHAAVVLLDQRAPETLMPVKCRPQDGGFDPGPTVTHWPAPGPSGAAQPNAGSSSMTIGSGHPSRSS